MKEPDQYVATMSKARRRGRIFIDYLRNERGGTAIAPYSVRARPGAPVAVPVQWSELQAIERANRWTVRDELELKRRSKARTLQSWGRASQVLPDL